MKNILVGQAAFNAVLDCPLCNGQMLTRQVKHTSCCGTAYTDAECTMCGEYLDGEDAIYFNNICIFCPLDRRCVAELLRRNGELRRVKNGAVFTFQMESGTEFVSEYFEKVPQKDGMPDYDLIFSDKFRPFKLAVKGLLARLRADAGMPTAKSKPRKASGNQSRENRQCAE